MKCRKVNEKRELFNYLIKGLVVFALVSMGAFMGIVISQVYGVLVTGIVILSIFVGYTIIYVVYSHIKSHKTKKTD